MFDFGNANDGQRKAIAAADGPVLITAGPGTGKTYTLVQRAIYLIEECNVRPESIFVATFTEKAAKELVTRITNELANRNITATINEMYIGTFHSLCLRMLKEHLEYTRLRRNYRLMDSFDQQYMVFQNIHRFRSIPEIEIVLPNGGAWKQAETICNFVNNLSEELVSPEELMSDHDPSIASLGRMLQEYRTILTEANLMDFSSIQISAGRQHRRRHNGAGHGRTDDAGLYGHHARYKEACGHVLHRPAQARRQRGLSAEAPPQRAAVLRGRRNRTDRPDALDRPHWHSRHRER